MAEPTLTWTTTMTVHEAGRFRQALFLALDRTYKLAMANEGSSFGRFLTEQHMAVRAAIDALPKNIPTPPS